MNLWTYDGIGWRNLVAVLMLAALMLWVTSGCAQLTAYVNQGAQAKVQVSVAGLHAARLEMCSVASVGAIRLVFPTEAEQQAWAALCGPMVLLSCEEVKP